MRRALLPSCLSLLCLSAQAWGDVALPRPAVARNSGYLRSGPGDDYYRTESFRPGQRFTVCEVQPDWCGVWPTAQSFSWIRADQVSRPGAGSTTVRGESVECIVGSALNETPDVTQARLAKGDSVEVIGEAAFNGTRWLKIVPPEGELRWVPARDLNLGPAMTGGILPASAALSGPGNVNLASYQPAPSSGFGSSQGFGSPGFGSSSPSFGSPGFGGGSSPFAGGSSPGAGAFASAGPTSSTPNMLGDLFGSGGQTIVIPARTRPFAGSFMNNGNLGAFSASLQQNRIVLTPVNPVQVQGIPLPPGTSWTSSQTFSVPPIPSPFALDENPQETDATRAAFPDADSVIFNSGQATFLSAGNPQTLSNSQYSIFTDYTIVDQPAIMISIPSPGGGGVVGRTKIAENTSPLPRDRVYFNYSYFDDVPFTASGVNVHRFSPGFEKTFNCERSSIEARFPFAATLNSDINTGDPDTSNLEWGDLQFTVKTILLQGPQTTVSGGLSVSLPTADDLRVVLPDGTELVEIENDSVHLMPFLGGLYTPSDLLFFQGFVQLDVDAVSSPVSVNLDGTGPRRVGQLRGATFLYLDVSMGYWVYRNDGFYNTLTGIAPMVELHYNRSLEDEPTLTAGQFQVGTPGNGVSLLNLVLGTTLQFRESTLSLGLVLPVSGTEDKQFDAEFRAFYNRFF